MSKNERVVLKTIESTMTDCTDGTPKVVASEKQIVYASETEPAFVKLYLQQILFLKSVPETTMPVLLALLKRLPYADDDPYISITKRVKTLIAEKTKLSLRSVERAITNLVRGKVLIRDKSSPRSANYSFNPYIVARGEWKDIRHLQLVIGISEFGTDFFTEINKAEEFEKRKKIFEAENKINQQTTVEPLSAEAQESWRKMAKNILEKQIEKSEKATKDLKQKLEQLEKGESLTTVLP